MCDASFASLPAESLLVAADQRLRNGTRGLCFEVGERSRTSLQASLAGTSKWQKLTEEETGKIEKSLSGTSKLLPSLDEDQDAKTVKLQSYQNSITMKEALAVLKEAAVEPPEEALKKPDLSPRANAGYSVYEEVAELRAFLEEAIQDDENEKTLKDTQKG
eukprot:g26888.t1